MRRNGNDALHLSYWLSVFTAGKKDLLVHENEATQNTCLPASARLNRHRIVRGRLLPVSPLSWRLTGDRFLVSNFGSDAPFCTGPTGMCHWDWGSEVLRRGRVDRIWVRAARGYRSEGDAVWVWGECVWLWERWLGPSVLIHSFM
jgi:hypothetical protein